MVLTEGLVMTRKELSDFFEISPKTFSNSRERYLNDLHDYAEYDLNASDKGRFKNVVITKVYCDTYYKSYKKDFITWLDKNDVLKMTGEEGYSNYSVITNKYCSEADIPYQGPHYIFVEFVGKTDEVKGKQRTVKENQKVPNPEFKIWHYLREICKRHLNCFESQYDYIEMKAEDINPTYLNIMTEEDKKMYDQIHYEIYGNQVSAREDMVDYIEEVNPALYTSEELLEEIKSLRLVRELSSQDKRALFNQRLAEAGLLKHKGYSKKK